MSQHVIRIDDETEALVGWDQMLETFFGQVYLIDENGERVYEYEENGEIKSGTFVWVGSLPPAIHDSQDLARKLHPYGVRITRELHAELYGDRDEGR